MIREVLSHFHLPLLSCVGLLIFFAVFLSALLWVFRRSGREMYQHLENLPLQEEGTR